MRIARSPARLVRSGRTYARGTAGSLRAARALPRGRYRLRVRVGRDTLTFPVRLG